MYSQLNKLIASACLIFGLGTQTYAQSLHGQEQSQQYGTTRGWTVSSLSEGYNNFAGCRAVKYENGELLALEIY